MLKVNDLVNFIFNNTDKLLFLTVLILGTIMSDVPPGVDKG